MSHDPVNRPSHYTEGKTLGIETISIIKNELSEEGFRGYLKGNALKYLSRAGKKGDAHEDIAKAVTYLNWLAETYGREADDSDFVKTLREAVGSGDAHENDRSHMVDAFRYAFSHNATTDLKVTVEPFGDRDSGLYMATFRKSEEPSIEAGQRYRGLSDHEFRIIQPAGEDRWLAAPESDLLDVKEIPSWLIKHYWRLIEKQEEPTEEPKPEIKPGQVWESRLAGATWEILSGTIGTPYGPEIPCRRTTDGSETSFGADHILGYWTLVKDAPPEEKVSEKWGRVIRKGQRWKGRLTGNIYTVMGPEGENGDIPSLSSNGKEGEMRDPSFYEYLDEGEPEESGEGEAVAESIIDTLNSFVDSLGCDPKECEDRDLPREAAHALREAIAHGPQDASTQAKLYDALTSTMEAIGDDDSGDPQEHQTPFGFEVSVALPDGSFLTGEPEAIATALRALWGVK